MRPFEYRRAASLAEALDLMSVEGPGTVPLAGGTDLLPLMDADVCTPSRLVDIKRTGDIAAGVVADAGGSVRIGALTPLADLERDAVLGERFPMLLDAVSGIATAQLRNAATIGGSLLQRPRCWYFRNPGLHCWLEGGDTCLAREGESREHAILGDGPCRAVHPSDAAAALMAYGARVRVAGTQGTRALELDALYAQPTPDRRRETVLDGELILDVELSAQASQRGAAAWVKETPRRAWSFALASAAVTLAIEDGIVADARIVLGGVASVPWRAAAAETVLEGGAADAGRVERACEAALAEAEPLADNGYKVELSRQVLRRALLQALPLAP